MRFLPLRSEFNPRSTHRAVLIGQGTEKVVKKAAHVSGRAGEKSGKGIENGAKDLGIVGETGVKDVGKGVDKGARKTADALK
jgi:hypothetical protein